MAYGQVQHKYRDFQETVSVPRGPYLDTTLQVVTRAKSSRLLVGMLVYAGARVIRVVL